MEPVRPCASTGDRLDAEERLDLVPGRDERERRHEGEHEQADPEPDVRALDGAPPLASSPGAGRARAGSSARSPVGRARAGPRRGPRWPCGLAQASLDCRQYFSPRWSSMPSGYRSSAWRRRRPQVAETGDLRVALDAVAAAVAEATRADLAVLRVLDDEGRLATRAVAPAGSSLGAEVAGTRGLCRGGRRRRADRADPPGRGAGPGSRAARAAGARRRPRRRLGRADPGRRGVRRRRSRARGARRRAARARRADAGAGGRRVAPPRPPARARR